MENGNFTITPAELVVTVKGGYSKTYGEENPAFDADITGFKRDDTKETVLNGELGFATLCFDLSDAGKYIVTAGNNNEDAVNPDCVVLEDGEEHIGSTFEVKSNTNFEKNYVIRYVNGDITVNPKELIVRIDHKVKTYGTADPAFTFHYEDNAGNVIGLIDPENSPLNVELYRTKGENVVRGDVTAADSLNKWGTTLYDGDYLISAKYDTNNKNYAVTVYDGSLKIIPATLTVTVDGGYKTTYGDEIPEFTYSITGFVGRDVKDETGTGIKDDESKVSGTATMYCNDNAGNPVTNKTKVGNYPINYDRQQLVADNSNYKFIYVGGDLTIGKKPIHVKADDQQKVYGEKDPDPLTWTITDPEELVNPGDEDFFDITTKRPGADTDDGEQVGKYPITIDGTDPSGNYEIITTPGTLTIVPATIVVTVIDDEKYFGEDNPTPNVTITGYKRGDTIDDIGGKDALKTKTDAEKWSPVGEYPVSAKDSTFHNPNYNFVYIDGKLTVKPLIINIKAEDDRKTYGDNDPDKFNVSYTLTNEKDEPYTPDKDLRDYIDRALNLDAARVPGENVRAENPGYSIVPTYTEVDNIEIGTVTPGHFFIDPREVTITANSAEKVYDGTPLTEPGYTYAPELVDNDLLGIHDKMDSVTVTGSQTEVGSSKNVPSDAVIINTEDGSGSNANYIIKYVDGTLTVRDKEIVSIEKSADRERATDYDVIRYTITVTNATSHDLHNVIVKDTNNFVGVPVLSQANGVTYDAEKGEFVIAEISHLRDETHTNAVTFTYTYTVAMVDEVVNYTITVKNTTDKTVTDLLVSDTNNFTGAITSKDNAKYTYNGNYTWTIPSIKAGESIDILYTYTVKTTDPSTLVNEADVRYTTDDGEYVIKADPVEVVVPKDGEVTIVKSGDKKIAEPGEVVTYTVTIHNGKAHDITNVVVSDSNNFAGTITGTNGVGYKFVDGHFVIDKIAAGADAVLTYTYTVQIADVPTHILENVATAHVPGTNPEDPENPGHGKDPDKPIDPDTDIPSNKVEVEVPGSEVETEIPEISITKSVDKPTAKIGDTLNYTVTVKNGGNADAENILIKDFFDGNGTLNFKAMDGVTDNGDNTYTISTVKAGESVKLRFSYVVVEGDEPLVLNAAVIKDPTPSVDVEKEADKHIAKVDEVVTYTISVKNTTSEPVDNVTVTDTNNFKGEIKAENADKYTYNGNKTWTIPTIAAGETIHITYTYTMQAEDATVIENIANVTYSKDGTDYNIPSNPVNVEKPDDGVVTIRKAADKTKAEPGEVVTYTVTVHNGKNHDIENARLTDTNNFAGEIVSVDGADYTFENGEFTINKIPAGGDVVIHYTYTVEIADVPTQILENIATIHVPGTNPEDPNNPGHGKDPEKPIDPDTEIPSNKVDVEVPGSETETEIPVIEITKSVDKAEAKVGDTLNYTVTVANKGKADAENVVVEDFFDGNGTLNFVPMDGVADNGDNSYTISTVKAGESVTLNFTYVVVTADAPKVLNAAVVKDPTPPIDVEKDADKYIAKVTDVVTYTITVKNTTDETVNDITVADHNNFAGNVTAESSNRYTYNGDGTWTIGYLDAGEALDIVYTYTVETTDESVMENTATIKYTHDGEQYNIPSNTVDVKKPDDGVVTIWKSANKTVAKPGETVTYTVTVHNGKDHDIQNAALTDENNFSGSIFAVDGAGYHYENGVFTIDTIPAGGDVVVHYAYTVGIADVTTHILENVATIHVPGTNPEDPENPGQGKDPTKPIDPDTDIPSNKVDVEVPGSGTETDIPLEKSLTIVKSADKTKVNVGETINYRVVVTNTGEVDLVNVTVKDNNDGASHIEAQNGDGYTYNSATTTFTIARIPVGESFTLTYSYVAVDADAGHDVINVAVAKAPGQNPEDPENPGHGKDPSKPIDEDVEKPSNEVKVPVVKPSTPTTPDEPKPTPTPDNPKPTPTPVPTEKPKTPPIGWLDIFKVDGKPFSLFSIFTSNKKTGIGFAQSIVGLVAMVGIGVAALVVVNHKRKKDENDNKDNHKDDSAE